MTQPFDGICKACQRELVQVQEDDVVIDTYHPARVFPAGATACPVLLPIPGTIFHSFSVPTDYFIEKED